MNLTNDAMLVDLTITAWSGRRYDREASDHVAAAHDALSSAGRYNKLLLPKSAFAALTAVVSEARKTHYAQTLPWDDKGARLLTVANYDRYTELLAAIRERMVRQRTRFIEDYDSNVHEARINLGKLFRIEDYPSKEALIGKFSIRYRITPVPDADHFMARLASDDTDRVKRDIEAHNAERLNQAITDLYRRLAEAVDRVSDRLRNDEEGKPAPSTSASRASTPSRSPSSSGRPSSSTPRPAPRPKSPRLSAATVSSPYCPTKRSRCTDSTPRRNPNLSSTPARIARPSFFPLRFASSTTATYNSATG